MGQRHQTKLYNITDGADSLLGTSEYNDTDHVKVTRSFITGVITITGTKVFEIQHQAANTYATSGFGLASNFATEVYAQVKVTQIG